MFITGILGKPDTYKASTGSFEASDRVRDLALSNPGRYITMVEVICPTAYIVGVRGRMDMEHIFSTEGEMTNKRDQLARYYGNREVYIIELTPKADAPTPADHDREVQDGLLSLAHNEGRPLDSIEDLA